MLIFAVLLIAIPAGAQTFFGGYRTVDQIVLDLNAAALAYPDIVEIVDYGDSYAKTQGGVAWPGPGDLAGYDLLAARITNRTIAGPKPTFFLMAGLHAAEISTTEVTLRFFDDLTSNYGVDPDITWLIDHHEIWILPTTNPDGYRLVEYGTEVGSSPWFWRKNANVAEDAGCSLPAGNQSFTDSATYGVDMNRNFDHQWDQANNERAGSDDPCSSYYHGPSPASEPEVAALQAQLSTLFADQRGLPDPDDTTGLFIQLHSDFEVIGSPWAWTSAAPPNQTGLVNIGDKFAFLNGYPHGQSNDIVYQMTGTADGWTYGALGVPAFLIELGDNTLAQYPVIDASLWPENRDLFLYAAKIARAPFSTVRGPDVLAPFIYQGTGEPVVRALVDDLENGDSGLLAAEAYVGSAPWQAGAVALPLTAVDGAYSSSAEIVEATLDTSGLAPGRHLVYVRGQDLNGDWGAVTATFLHVNSNTAPTVDSSLPASPAVVQVGDNLTFSVSASDAESDPLTITWRLDGFPIAGATGNAFTFFPSAADIGSHTLTASVSDGEISALESWQVTVDPGPGGPDITSGLLAYWQLEEAAGATTVADASGNSNTGTVVGDPTPIVAQVDNGFTLDGNDAFDVNASSTLDGPPALTLSAWIRHGPTTGWRTIIDKRDGNADGYDLYIDPTSRLFIRVDDQTLAGQTIIADNAWHHVAGVYDGSRLTLYVDGVVDATAVASLRTVSTTAQLRVGRHWNNVNTWFIGDLDEVRVYGRALVAAEIVALRDVTGGPDTAPPVRSNGGPTQTLPAGTTSIPLSLTTNEIATCNFDTFPDTPFQVMRYTFSTPEVTQHDVGHPWQEGDPTTFYVRCSDGANVNTDDFEITVTVATGGGGGNGPLAHWTFDEAPGSTIAADVTGNGYDGVAVGNPDFVPAQFANGVELDGNDAFVVSASPALDAPAEVTMAAWIKHSLTAGWRTIIDKRDGLSDGYDLYINTSSQLYMRVNNRTLSSSTTVADGEWHHVAGVFDGTDLVLYVDGIEDGRLSDPLLDINTTADLEIGRNWNLNVNSFFSGQLDDLRLYDRALTASEIAALAVPPMGSQPITVDAFVDKRVLQRSFDGAAYTADFNVTGTYDGIPGSIEGRVVSEVGGTEIVPWTTLDSAPAGGTWNGTFTGVPQGGWYRVEVRFSSDPSTDATSTARFGVGMILATIGQSNMVKHFTEDAADGSVSLPAETAHPLTYRYGYGEPPGYEYARPRNDDIPVSWGNVTGTGGIRMANNLQAALGIPVLILDFSLDWTGIIAHWNDTSGNFPGWPRFESALNEVGAIEAVLWHQGAFDGQITSTTVASYKNGLDTLYTQITDLVGGHGTLPFVLAIQNRGVYNQDLAVDDSYNAVRQAQLEWIDERPYAFAAGNSVDIDISTRPGTGDGHFFAAGYEILADRYTRGLLHALDVPGYGAGIDGGHILSAELQSNVVVVDVAHDQGTRLTLQDPNSEVEGFTLSETPWVVGGARNELAITSAVLSDNADGNQVLITLAETPTGSIYLRYLHGQNPFHYKASDAEQRANGNTLYDNFAYHPARSGLPINGTTVDIPVVTASTPSLLVTPSSLVVAEDGGTGAFDVVLGAQPASDVVLDVTSADPARASVSAASLTFSSTNWSTPQTVTVTGHAVAGASQVIITVSVNDALSDDAYDPLADRTVQVSLTSASDPDLDVRLELDEVSGTTAANSGANGIDGTVIGGPVQGAPGVFGTAYSFDETNDRITLPNFTYASEFSVSLWFKVGDNSGNYYQYLYSQGQFGDPNSLNILIGESGNSFAGNELAVNFRDADDPQGIWSNVLRADATGLIDDQWHLATFTVSVAAGAQLYVDGVLVDSLPNLGGGSFVPTSGVTLGTRNYSPGSRWYGGSMDDVRVYQRALTAAEVANLHAEAP